MAIVLQLEGRKRQLNAGFRNTNTNIVYRYHLYKNNYTPLTSSVIGNFTESDFGSYTSWTVAAAGWGSPTDDGTCSQVAAAATTRTSTDASGQSAYGYYVTDDADGALLYSEKFASAVDMGSVGRSVIVTPNYNNQTGAAC